jgi:uncharacterized membrane protein
MLLKSQLNKYLIPFFLFFVLNVSIVCNVPFLRQAIGFLVLTIVPGLLFLQIMKLDKLENTEKFVLSVGLSISFLMLFGLLINYVLFYLGYEKPLSCTPLLIFIDLLFIFAIIRSKLNKDTFTTPPIFTLTRSEKVFLIFPIFFPFLSVFGMQLMNANNNNILLIVLLLLIPIYIIFICILNQHFPIKLYPIVLFLISISLILIFALRSNHLIGVDTHNEYYLFQLTLKNLHWNVISNSTLDSSLSISLLPTIYQSLLSTNSETLFKLLYPILFSISPLIVYIISKKYIGALYGFLSSCTFMFFYNFLWTSYHARTNIAILFFALAIMSLFSINIPLIKKKVLFILFIVSCLFSHYSTSYIFFIVIFLCMSMMKIFPNKSSKNNLFGLTTIFLFFVTLFFWYGMITKGAFHSGVIFIEKTLLELTSFFLIESRGATVQVMFGEGVIKKTIPQKIEFVFSWLKILFTCIGMMTLIGKYKETTAYYGATAKVMFGESVINKTIIQTIGFIISWLKSLFIHIETMSFIGIYKKTTVCSLDFSNFSFLVNKFEIEYFFMSIFFGIIYLISIIFPFISIGYSLDRIYFLGSVILSIFYVIGGIKIAECLKISSYFVILLVLIPYFFCVTGVAYEACNVPRDITLNSEGELYDKLYIHDQESYGILWLGKHHGDIPIYGDQYSNLRFISQCGMNSLRYAEFIDNKEDPIYGYIFLRYTGAINHKLLSLNFIWHDMTEYSHILNEKNKIYNNGGSEVYFSDCNKSF